MKRQQGDVWSIAWSLYRLGNLAKEERDYRRAVHLQKEHLTIRHRLQDPLGIARCLGELASLALSTEQPERAALLCAAAAKELKATGTLLPRDEQKEVEEVVGALPQHLGEAAFAAAWAEGWAMPLEQLVTYALAPEVG